MNNDINFNNQQNNQQYQNANNNVINDQQNYNGHQDHSNQNNQTQNLQQQGPQKNKNILKIVLVVVAVIVIILLAIKIFGGSSSDGTAVELGKEITVKNKLYNLTISVGDVQRGVVYTTDGTVLSVFDLDGTYTKVKVTIKNNSNSEEEIGNLLIPINLMDSSKTEIASCNYGSTLQDEKLTNEKLPDTIPANSTVSGYVYCETDSTSGTILNINVPSNVSTNNTGGYTVTGDEYYFNLN